MASIPTIPGTSQIQTQAIGVKRNAGPSLQLLDQAARTFGEGAQAVSDAAGAIAEYEMKKRKAEENSAFNEASIKMRKATSEFRTTLRHNPNDRDWVEQWNKIASDTSQTIIADKRFVGEARRRMTNELKAWQSSTTSEFSTAADIAGSERRKRTGLLAADEALKDGNEKAANAVIDGLVETGDMFPEEGEKMKRTFGQTIEENQIRTGIMANPHETIKDIDAGHFRRVPKNSLLSLRRQAEAELSRQQGQTRDDLVARLDAGELISEDEISAKENVKQLSGVGAKSIRSLQTKRDYKDAQDKHGLLMLDVQAHDWASDKDMEKTAESIKDRGASLPPAMRKTLYDYIDKEMKAAKTTGQKSLRPVENDIYKRAEQDFNHGMFAPLVEEETGFWSKKMETRAMTADELASREGRQAEELEYSKYLTQMRSWFKANPEATDEQAQAKSNQLMRPYVMRKVGDSLVPKELFNKMSSKDREAVEWAQKHSDDPRAKEIMEGLNGG